MKKVSPCKNCSKRVPGCHAYCIEGQAYEKEQNEKKQQIRQAKEKEKDINSFKYQQVMKMIMASK